MTCLRDNLKGADLLMGYLEGTITSEERAKLDQHALACVECRGLLAVQGMLDEQVPEVSADFDARLYARIQWDEQRKWWRLLWRPAVPLAAAAAVLVVVFMVRTPVTPVDDPKQASMDRVEIEQLEQALDDLELLMPVSENL
jgi:hypothetical protein